MDLFEFNDKYGEELRYPVRLKGYTCILVSNIISMILQIELHSNIQEMT